MGKAKSFLEAYQEIMMGVKLSELRNTLKKFQSQLPQRRIAQYRKDNQSSVGKGLQTNNTISTNNSNFTFP